MRKSSRLSGGDRKDDFTIRAYVETGYEEDSFGEGGRFGKTGIISVAFRET